MCIYCAVQKCGISTIFNGVSSIKSIKIEQIQMHLYTPNYICVHVYASLRSVSCFQTGFSCSLRVYIFDKKIQKNAVILWNINAK